LVSQAEVATKDVVNVSPGASIVPTAVPVMQALRPATSMGPFLVSASAFAKLETVEA
jgi:hypothetical protein